MSLPVSRQGGGGYQNQIKKGSRLNGGSKGIGVGQGTKMKAGDWHWFDEKIGSNLDSLGTETVGETASQLRLKDLLWPVRFFVNWQGRMGWLSKESRTVIGAWR